MSTPRFREGQLVVVHGTSCPEINGETGTVIDRRMANFEWSQTFRRYQGWVYRLDTLSREVPEQCLRPFDPPSDWDKADSVWKPDVLKETEGV